MSDTDDQQGDGHVDPTAPPPQDPLATPPSPYPPTEPVPQAPSYDQPAYGQAPYDQPAYPQPTYGQPAVPPVPPAPGYGAQPGSNPYAPPAQPPAAYGHQPAYGQQPTHGQPAYGQPYAGTYVRPTNNGSGLALTIVSAVSVAFCGGLLVIPALIFGIVSLTKQSSDPEGSRRMSRNGWWAYGIGVAVSLVAVIAAIAFFVASESSGSVTYDGY